MTLPAPVAPMLATPGQPPAGPGWAFEWKWDGVRAMVAVDTGGVVARSRNLRDITSSYPELRVLPELVDRPLLLDGELVTLDDRGRPDFGRLQSRMHVARPRPELLESHPVAFFVFDLLHDSGRDLTREPYEDRRGQLAELALDAPPTIRVPDHYLGDEVTGPDLLEIASQSGLEGIVAKRVSSPYAPGRRSRDWIKTPLRQTQEVIIGGWVPGEGRRAGTLGALLLGVQDDQGQLVYVGHVGTGFTDQVLGEMRDRLAPLARQVSPFEVPVPREFARRARWVEPVLVGEVEHRQWTGDNRLRHPSWRGLRPDRDPAEIRRAG
ncbi:non-homologous end-joining DNA ligase [Amycolatopsis thermophila]|uniref:DNA ligase (ATP) n=1 Tax=Amycolatopsis thermophila TaxID=206084 RepID=A0ABU0ERM7_9PSEU|nr:non-homologous end-joining DNA ligase [Amycolatopsis thermophila]MDQ0377939.1 bifunctional non-homologous end joining protein LigD [Amycolatopsis thermophila]